MFGFGVEHGRGLAAKKFILSAVTDLISLAQQPGFFRILSLYVPDDGEMNEMMDRVLPRLPKAISQNQKSEKVMGSGN
jgi:hypothetical protein